MCECMEVLHFGIWEIVDSIVLVRNGNEVYEADVVVRVCDCQLFLSKYRQCEVEGM